MKECAESRRNKVEVEVQWKFCACTFIFNLEPVPVKVANDFQGAGFSFLKLKASCETRADGSF